MVAKTLEEVAPAELKSESFVFQTLLDASLKNPDFDVDDLKDIYAEFEKHHGTTSGRNLGKKVQSSTPSKAQTTTTKTKKDPLTFDEL